MTAHETRLRLRWPSERLAAFAMFERDQYGELLLHLASLRLDGGIHALTTLKAAHLPRYDYQRNIVQLLPPLLTLQFYTAIDGRIPPRVSRWVLSAEATVRPELEFLGPRDQERRAKLIRERAEARQRRRERAAPSVRCTAYQEDPTW